MPLTRSPKFAAQRRLRPARPSCRGGASSVLRLASPEVRLLPTALELSGWMSRAANVLMPVTGPHGDFVSHVSVAGA